MVGGIFQKLGFEESLRISASARRSNKGSAAFCSKLPKLYTLLGHDMKLKMVQMGRVTSFSTLAHKFVGVLQFQNML